MIGRKHPVGKYLVIEISEEFTVIADLQDLDIYLDGLINHGDLFIAIRFEKISYIYSGALSVLIKNTKKLKDKHGEICLLEPNREVDDVIRVANLHNVINIFHSEDELLSYQGKLPH